MEKIAVLTSGGDAPGMNAAVRAVVRQGIFLGLSIYGIPRGFYGLLQRELELLELGSVADIIHRGGTVLHTARCPDFLIPKRQQQAAAFLKEEGIDGLIVIGGDGSFRGALALARHGISVMGIPGTIDNDLSQTDYCIGFDTAVNTVTDAINKLRDTATSHERVYVVEVMGRDAGHIALAAGLAGGAESILVPEVPFDLMEICHRLERGVKRGKKHSIIVVAEGAASGLDVGKRIKDCANMETRTTILGHLQRGGTPSAFDRILASRLGAKAVLSLYHGSRGLMAGYFKGEVKESPLEKVLEEKKELNWDLYHLAGILSI